MSLQGNSKRVVSVKDKTESFSRLDPAGRQEFGGCSFDKNIRLEYKK